MSLRRALLRHSITRRIPGLARLARIVSLVASVRVGRLPLGLLALLPVALAIDALDVADELLGPVGVVALFVLEAAFVLGVTGRPDYAVGFAAFDLIPGLDVLPVATLTLLKALADARDATGAPGPTPARPQQTAIDV